MIAVQWMHDAEAAEYQFQYFTRGTLEQQREDAKRFAASLGIDPELGYVSIMDFEISNATPGERGT